MKNIILLFIIMAVGGYAQTTPPSAYTTHYGLRQWSQGARPSADSLNKNWKDIDSIMYKIDSYDLDTTRIALKDSNVTFSKKVTFLDTLYGKSMNYFGVTAADGLTRIAGVLYYDIYDLELDTTFYSQLTFNFSPVITLKPVDTAYVQRLTIPSYNGQIITFMNRIALNIRFVNNSASGSGAAMRLNSDAILNQFDTLTLMGYNLGGTRYWVELSRSNN